MSKRPTKYYNLLVCFPDVAKRWDYSKNEKGPEEYTPKSGVKVFWLCDKCKYSWKTRIANRTGLGNDCPACANQVVTKTNNLKSLFPDISEEWHPHLNTSLCPEEVTYGTAKTVWWLCGVCGYEWRTSPNKRTSDKTKCPACSGQVPYKNNRLSNIKELVQEWDFSKNNSGPENYTRGSGRRVYWVCSKCSYSWKSAIHHRAGNGRGCPRCAKGGNISKPSQRWLDSLSVSKSCREVREVVKGRLFKFDGFDPETNTVYEFLGDFWHGNPERFEANEINPVNKKTYGQLYKDTFKRIDHIKSAGYKVVYIWESDFNLLE